MEGPSLVLLREELTPFLGRTIIKTAGNTKIRKELLNGRRITGIKTWGKLLLLQTGGISLKAHFLMFGSYRINERKVGRVPRLRLIFENGELNLYSCSVAILTDAVEDLYDWRVDPMSEDWDPSLVRRRIAARPEDAVCDVLLDQQIFSGVGNIIKNEVLFILRLHPLRKIRTLPARMIPRLIAETRDYCFRFLAWKRSFVLKKNWLIYRRKSCPDCGGKVCMTKTGELLRISFFCQHCQRLAERERPEHAPTP